MLAIAVAAAMHSDVLAIEKKSQTSWWPKAMTEAQCRDINARGTSIINAIACGSGRACVINETRSDGRTHKRTSCLVDTRSR
jgi:hypothetical protein